MFLAVSVTTYGDGHILASVLSGVKSIIGSGEFTTIVVITFLLGTLFVAYGTLLGTFQIHSTIKNILSHYFILIVLFYALLVPKEDVLIYDAIDSSPGSTTVVENVPYGVSMLLWFSNTIERKLTEIFDNAFNTPFGYSGYGYNYYNMLINELTNVKSANPYFNASMTNYVKDCFFYDVIAGDKSIDQVLNSNNVWQSMSPVSSASVITTIKCDPTASPNLCLNNQGSKTTATVGCSTAYGYIDGLLSDNATVALNDLDKKILNGAVNLPTVAQTILNVSSTSESLIKQAIVSNYLPEAYKNAIAMLSNSEVTQYSTAMAEVQSRQQMLTSGEMAKRYLPVIRWILNGMVYGGFPLLFIVALTPIGLKAVQGYMGLGLAQISWGPLFSILNNVVYTKTVDEFSTVLGQFTPAKLVVIHNATENLIALSGQVAWLIPIATLSIAGVGFLGAGSLISSIGSVAQSSAISAGAQASGLSGIKQAEVAGYMQGASVTGYSMGDLMYTGNAWSAFRTAAMANPDAMPGTVDLSGPALAFTDGLTQVAELGVLSKSGAPAAPTILGASAATTRAIDKAKALGLTPSEAGRFEQNPVLTKDMLEKIPNLSPQAKKALEGAFVPGGLDSIALTPKGELASPLAAIKQEGGLRHMIYASPDGDFYTVTDGAEGGIAYTGVTTNSEGQIITGVMRGNFNIGGQNYMGALTVDGSSLYFNGIDPKTGQQVFWSGNIGTPLKADDVRPSSGIISSKSLDKLYETGNYTGPVNVAGIEVTSGVIHREGGVTHINGVLSDSQVKALSNTLKHLEGKGPEAQKARSIVSALKLSSSAIQTIHDAAKRGQGLLISTTQNPDGTYANTQFFGGASAVVNNSGVTDMSRTADHTWTTKKGSINTDHGVTISGQFTAQELEKLYNNAVDTMGENHPVVKAIKDASDYAKANHTMVQADWTVDPETGQMVRFEWSQHAAGLIGGSTTVNRDSKQVNVGPHYNASLWGLFLDKTGLGNKEWGPYIPSAFGTAAGIILFFSRTGAGKQIISGISNLLNKIGNARGLMPPAPLIIIPEPLMKKYMDEFGGSSNGPS